MAEQVQGIINNINTKTVRIKKGPKAGTDSTVYEAELDTGHRVNLGFTCKHTQGESVNWTLEATNFGDYKLIAQGGASAPQATAPAQPAQKSFPAPSPKREFPIDKSSRGMSITRQNSGGHAAVMVAALIEKGVIDNTNDALDAWIDMAYTITDFATGHREEAQAAAMQIMEDS